MSHDIWLVLAGGGIAAALLKFIEFLITHFRHNKEYNDDVDDKIENAKQYARDHLTEVNNQWKIDYCDRNFNMIEDLRKDVKEGLAERENTGAERYLEHKKAIEELRKAMISLTKNTDEITQMGKYMGQALMGLTHDKIVFLGKKYQKRGAITLAEQNNLKLLYKPYHDGLGGNSDGEGYFTYCMNLPIITDEEAIEMDKRLSQEDKT